MGFKGGWMFVLKEGMDVVSTLGLYMGVKKGDGYGG